MTGWIGISLGDVTGVGPEVTLKTLAAEAATDDTRYLILGDLDHALRLNRQLGLNLPIEPYTGPCAQGRFFVQNALPTPLPERLAPGAPAAAKATLAWLADGARRCLNDELDALVTAPVNKEAIIHSGEKFIGQTEFLSERASAKRTAMMLLGHDEYGRWLRVVLATTHVALKLVSENLTRAKIELAIDLAAQSCVDLGLPQSRVAVCGLNPHAGEGGEMGDEEITTITPAVAAAQKRHPHVSGPFAADALFHRVFRGDFEVVVAMYHDQGLAPLKMIAFESGVNWTLGLPFIRTSPDHGTAYDIAGQGIANPSSMRSALRLAKQLARAKSGKN